MKRIGMGLVGAGFVGPHHVDAVRRLGFVDVVAVAGSSEASARAKADSLHVEKAYGSYEELLDDPRGPGRPQRDAELPALRGERGGDRQGQARRLRQAAGDDGGRGEIAARPGRPGRHRPRGDVQLSGQSARPAGAPGDRPRRHRHAALRARPLPAGLADQGHRLFVAARARQGRRLVGARRHRIALVRPGAARQRPAHHPRARRSDDVDPEARRKPQGSREAFQAAGSQKRPSWWTSRSRTSRRCWSGSTTARKGAFSVGQVCAGHKNDVQIEVCGSTASMRWRQEDQNELWIGHRDAANQVLQKDPSLLDEAARPYAHLPGGHQEAGRTRSAT